MGLWGEERLVDVDLGVDVDGVIADVEELDDLGLGELFDRALAAAMRDYLLAGGLNKQNN